MEYLMTYGWAILIIAVVLGVLYYLGIFNSANLAPRLQPGSCHVARTAAGVQNFGVCSGLPEFVATLYGYGGMVYTSNSIETTGPITGIAAGGQTNAMTITAWVKPSSAQSIATQGPGVFSTVGYGMNLGDQVNHIWLDACGASSEAFAISGANLADGGWHFVYISYNYSSNTVLAGIDGQGVSAGVAGPISITANTPVYIGAEHSCGPSSSLPWRGFNGSIANVQFYNASLSQVEITALYKEGIGGAPIKPAAAVGWWPLNGDTNDYSGNNNNAQATDVQYTNTWLSSYSGPS